MKAIVNFSGGKDSTVAVLEAMKLYPPEDITLCWQDTGAEYAETEGHVKLIAETLGLKLVTLRHPEGFFGLAKRKGYWPTPDCRHCTRELKQHVFDKWLRKNRDGDETIVVSGIRADESLSWAKLPEWSTSEALSTKAQTVTLWNPCLHMTAEQVFARVKAEGLPLHPCYEFSPRCSCWLCFFQHPNVVRTYAEMHPELYAQACELEDEIGHTWKDGLAMNDLMKQGRLL